jgi:uncharacterized membrane protein YphA (DoxX/SURF4 family)
MISLLNCKCAEKWAGFAPLILRVVVGIVFVYAGWQKIQMGTEAISGYFAGAGIPLAGFFAPLVMWIEFLGGIALILGLWTHLTSKLLGIIMIVAIITLLKAGFAGYELPLILLATLISIMITGPGKYAVNLKKSAAPMAQ